MPHCRHLCGVDGSLFIYVFIITRVTMRHLGGDALRVDRGAAVASHALRVFFLPAEMVNRATGESMTAVTRNIQNGLRWQQWYCGN
eukprot:scaffold620576_cov19-Prasinocladus_malaysianus.AAC.1